MRFARGRALESACQAASTQLELVPQHEPVVGVVGDVPAPTFSTRAAPDRAARQGAAIRLYCFAF
jgi:hypothetical protein